MIYLIITTCIVNKFGIESQEERMARYLDCIGHTLNIVREDKDIIPVIVENSGISSSYLDIFACDVLYTNNNQYHYTHKAINELLDIHSVISHYKISDDDIIVKLTGRYKMLDKSFINTVKMYSNTHDAFVKFFNVCTLQYLHDDCVLGLFAVKRKYFADLQYTLSRSPECEFAIYIREKAGEKVKEISHLNLECRFADDMRYLLV